jgi:hypothetical protein
MERNAQGNGSENRAAEVSPRRRKVRVQAEIPAEAAAEFELMMLKLRAGKRERALALERERATIQAQAVAALEQIETSIRSHPGTGQARRLVSFLACLYNRYEYRFDLSDLRALDTRLANACLDYLNYDRLGVRDLDQHLGDGGRELRGWIEGLRG